MKLSRWLAYPLTVSRPPSTGVRAVLVVACLALSAAQRAALVPWLPDGAPYATLFLGVLIAAWGGGAGAGLAVSVLGVGTFTWAFAETDSAPPGAEHYISAGLTLVQCVFISLLCGVVHRAAAERRDVRRRARAAVENLADHAPGLMWSVDTRDESGFVNHAWRTFTGVSPDLRAVDRLRFVHASDRDRVRSVFKEARAGGMPYQIEYRLRRADGAYRWILEHAVPRFDRDGQLEGFTGTGTDVTPTHQERDELRFVGDLHRGLSSSLDLQKTAETLTQAIVPAVADWCTIHLLDARSGILQIIHESHVDPERLRHANEAADHSATPVLFARLLADGEPRHEPRVDEGLLAELSTGEAHLAHLRLLGLVSFLAVPLLVAGRTIGVLSLASAESRRVFGPETLRLALKVGGIAAFALENARLYRGMREALAAESLARRELENSERRLRSAWEADIFGICVVNRDGEVGAGNDAFLRLVGHTREDLEAGRVNLRSRFEGRELRFGSFIWEILDRGARCEPFEEVCVRADGVEIPVLVGGGLNPEGGSATVFILDLSARKAAENELRRQRGLLKTIIDAVPAMVAYVDSSQRFILHNRQYEEWLGVEAGAISGRSLFELAGDTACPRFSLHIRHALAGHAVNHEAEIEGAGRRRNVMINYRPDIDDRGRVVGVVLHAYDITESRRLAAGLARSERRHRTLIHHSAAIVWTADARGVIQEVDGWEDFTGIGAEPGTCPMWFRVIHAEDRERVHADWPRAGDKRRAWESVHRMLAADGRHHHVHARAAAVVGADGAIEEWIGTISDIDAQRRAYLELEYARNELSRHADKLESEVRVRTARLQEVNEELEAFTYSASHDLRVPLHHVHGFAQAILEDRAAGLSASSHANLRLIVKATERMDTLIGDLLAYSRLSRTEIVIVPTALEPILNDVLAQHRGTIQARHAVIEVKRPLPRVPADRISLQQILLNLVGNALKFVPEGRRPEIRVRVERRDGRLRLWVEDNGIGIEKRHLETIFKLFQRLHGAREYPGTGIGLSIVKRAAARMGGECGVESEPGAGSRFWVDFQADSAPAPETVNETV